MKARELEPELKEWIRYIEEKAKGYGLNFPEVVFEKVDYKEMNELASLGGFPQRYPHWRFGMEYDRISKSYTYGLSKIYEMVINTEPCYAYLLSSNSLVENKLVIAHVYGHADFFKNNHYFSKTNRRMLDEMANHSTLVRQCQERYGVEVVEEFVANVAGEQDNAIVCSGQFGDFVGESVSHAVTPSSCFDRVTSSAVGMR